MLSLNELYFSYGDGPILDGVNLQVSKRDRVCLFGRNGEGKSTLMKLVTRELKPDSGTVDILKNAIVAGLPQEVPGAEGGTVSDVIIRGLGALSEHILRYQAALRAVSEEPTSDRLDQLERAQSAVDSAGGWEVQQRVETVISRLSLDGDAPFDSLSGGWRRRVFLARALAMKPDILLLDEPTNHLDIDAIEWLEQTIERYEGAVIFVTHDRAFLRKIATRIVELDRGHLVEFPPDFDAYVESKTHALDVEEKHDALFDKKLAEEEKWIRTPIQARRTRNEGRVRALKKLRDERKQRRGRKGKANIVTQTAARSGDLVIEAKNVTFRYDTPLIEDFSLMLKRGDRLGLIGPNGVGKTTLLDLLLGRLEPQSGSVRLGTNLEIGYFDQLRNELDPEKTLAETVVDKGDFVEIGERRKHVVGYLRDFLFSDSQVRAKVSTLSGGERNRLLLAKLFARPSNLLVMDEPTNDLDIETLEVLETQLLEFDGTIILVSHDREFLDNAVTDSLIFEGDARITRVVGAYDVWDELKKQRNAPVTPKQLRETAEKKSKNGLTYAERLELEKLPDAIAKLENDQSRIHQQMALPDVASDLGKLNDLVGELQRVESELERAMDRWGALETKSEL